MMDEDTSRSAGRYGSSLLGRGRILQPVRAGCARRWLLTGTVLAIASGTLSAAVVAPSPEPMTLAQVMEAGAAGTGCSWSLPGDRRIRFAAADDRAAIRLGGRIVVLAPAPHARELFPFTFADWQTKGLTARVRQIGTARRRGSEATTARATLTIALGRASRRMVGTMSCGS